jgi:hypothetical protein
MRESSSAQRQLPEEQASECTMGLAFNASSPEAKDTAADKGLLLSEIKTM